MSNHPPGRRGGIPRGLSTSGPILFSYGFRPFFLAAGLMALMTMILWILVITGKMEIGGSYGAQHWHAHEMLFGFAPAVVAGFLLTSIPNWTGRLPVSGRPLMALIALWLAGRVLFLQPDLISPVMVAIVDSLFLPVLFLVFAREIVTGRKWRDAKVLVILAILASTNIAFHILVLAGGDGAGIERLAISAYVVLITIMGGRIIPSFTRNWLNQRGETRFPVPFGRFDNVTIACGAIAVIVWAILPDGHLTMSVALVAFVFHAVRLARWRGHAVLAEKLLFILHAAYAFVPLGFLAMALGAEGLLAANAVLHVLTVGAMATMMLAVMTRAIRGHTGRVLRASGMTTLSYAAVVLAALLRPLADVIPVAATGFYAGAGLAWILAFGLFVIEYGPMLVRVRRAGLG